MRKIYYFTAMVIAFFASSYTFIKPQSLLDPTQQPQFKYPLPIPQVLDGRRDVSRFSISISQFDQFLGLVDPITKQPLMTTVWGYNGSYPGPTILARKNKPIKIFWNNNLIDENKLPLPHLFPVDPTVHWALKDIPDWEKYGVPVVTHLHGGLTESASDGLPDAWYTPGFVKKGSLFRKGDHEPYLYSNQQESATVWYHDHALGITRLNVYAGLAGFYLITDDNETSLVEQGKLPSAPYDIGLAIQDRIFDATGQLHYPSESEEMGSHLHSVQPEFFGNFILVNGMTWPVLEVEPRPYRFRLLNGSDSRFYNLFLSNKQSFVQIGSDDGLLYAPYEVSKMLLGTGERRDVIIDFSNLSGQTIILKNDAKTPYPNGNPVDDATTGRIMAFKVTKPLDTKYPLTSLPTYLRPPINRLSTNLPSRKLILFESIDEYGRLKPMLGTAEHGVLEFHDPVTENPKLNTTEVWEIYNATEDAHTIHLHMVSMQLIDRQIYEADTDPANGKLTNIRFLGSPKLPEADEAGWKDTYVAMPGEVTRVIASFNLKGNSAWHCHILSHEDHEMMRPYFIGNLNDNNNKSEIVAKSEEIKPQVQFIATPNPFINNFTVQFKLSQAARVRLSLYDQSGSMIKSVFDGDRNTGVHQFEIEGSQLANGVYYCELVINNQKLVHKLIKR